MRIYRPQEREQFIWMLRGSPLNETYHVGSSCNNFSYLGPILRCGLEFVAKGCVNSMSLGKMRGAA